MGVKLTAQPNVLYATKNEQSKKNTNFKGATPYQMGWVTRRFEDVNSKPIVGYTAVDFGAMVVPRTVIDLTRNVSAGIETFSREAMSNVLTCLLPGVFAQGYEKVLQHFSTTSKNKFSNFATTNTIEHMNNVWNRVTTPNGDKAENLQKFVKSILNNTKGLVGDDYKHFSKEKDFVNTTAKRLTDLILENKSKKEIKESLKALEQEMVTKYQASANVHVYEDIEDINKSGKNKPAIKTSMGKLLEDIHSLGENFFNKISDKDARSEEIKSIQTINGTKTILGICSVGVINTGFQYFNRWLTKRRTGSDAFVGDPNFEKTIKANKTSNEKFGQKVDKEKSNEDKTKFLLQRLAGVAGIVCIGLATATGRLNPLPVFKEPGKFLRKIEFNGMFPSTKQLAMIYTTTILGRILASRDKNELRETVTRDYLGFANWLILGGFVSKLYSTHIATKFGLTQKDIFNTEKKLEPHPPLMKRIKNFLSKQSLKSHAEIIAQYGQNEVDKAKCARLIKHLNISIGVGLLYSTLALGIVVPLINKTITNRKAKNQKADEEKAQQNVKLESKTPLIYNPKLEDTNKKL